KASHRVIGLGAVVVYEHPAVATIRKQRTAQRAHIRRRGDPARGLAVELAERLQRPVLLLAQQLDTHGRRLLDRAGPGLMRLARIQRLPVVTQAAPARRAL